MQVLKKESLLNKTADATPCWKKKALHVNWWCYLVPGVGSFGWVDQDADNFGFGNEAEHTLWDVLMLKVGGALLKQVCSRRIGRQGEELHVPEREIEGLTQCIYGSLSGKLVSSGWLGLFLCFFLNRGLTNMSNSLVQFFFLYTCVL